MDVYLRDLINNSMDDLVRGTKNLVPIIKHLKCLNVLQDYHELMIMNFGYPKNAEMLYTIVTKRGPQAYEHLLEALKEGKCEKLLPPLIHVRKVKGVVERNPQQCYRMESYPRGVALIVNMYEFKYGVHKRRDGSIIDESRMSHLFSELGFEIRLKRNLYRNDLKNEIKSISKVTYGDACVIIIMSHGEETKTGVKIVCHDNEVIDSTDEILPYFSNTNEYFALKPKLFFFQTCRGNCRDFTYSKDSTDNGYTMPSLTSLSMDASPICNESTNISAELEMSCVADPPPSVNMYKNILIAYSTIPGFVSQRDDEKGAYFIYFLYNIFCKQSHDTHLQDLLIQVKQKTEQLFSNNGIQAIHLDVFHFSKHLFFNPGFYVEVVSDNGNSSADIISP